MQPLGQNKPIAAKNDFSSNNSNYNFNSNK